MAYWLLKTEPTVYSYNDLVRDKTTTWDGVTNNLALKHIRNMKKGDLVFVYHTGSEKCLAGIAEIASDPFPDPKKNDPKIAVVEIKAKEPLKKTVSLADIKAKREFATFELVRLPRLSVMPVSAPQWKTLVAMSR